MKYTLLDMTQTILSSMDSDEVNSIDDNVEAQQVAVVIRTCYYDLIARSNLPEHYDTFELEASLDPTKPTVMYLPDTIHRLQWLRYNKIASGETDQNFESLTYLPFNEFTDRMYRIKESQDDTGFYLITSTGGDTFKIMYQEDRAPSFYTIYNDRTVIFDSYDSSVEATLQRDKTLAYGLKAISFSLTDSFVPVLDDEQFPLLLNEAKALAWMEMKQQPHQKAELSARRQWSHLQGNKKRFVGLSDFQKLPDFGRK